MIYLPLNLMTSPTRVIILFMLSSLTSAWIVPQPQQNIWVTLAQTLQQENICLSTAAAGNPMSTCLVGIPLLAEEYSVTFNIHRPGQSPKSRSTRSYRRRRAASSWNPIEKLLPNWPVAQQEPQELELLGSSPAHFCIHFVSSPAYMHSPEPATPIVQHKKEFTAKRWCRVLSHVKSNDLHKSPPRTLPKGLFLICGDRAWAGIPSRPLGGPCTIGRLSLLAPNQTLIGEWIKKNNSDHKVQKRSIEELDQNCNSDIFHWSKSKRVAASLFLPWVAAAKALGELGHLECWVVKQANFTSTAISYLLEDEETTRQATLQNRAAIDFLLLLHGHECQEFEGLCCMNLTSKAPNVHTALREMKNLIGQVKQESEDWFSELFQGWGLSGWWTSIVKTILMFLVILFLIVLAFGILRCLILKALSSFIPTPPEVNHTEFADPEQHTRPANHGWWIEAK